MKVVFLEEAELDLKELRDHIVQQFGRETWRTSYGKIKSTVNGLKTYPLLGSIPQEMATLDLTQYRQIISGMNRIIYEVRQDTVFIHIVCDGRRNMKSLLTRRLLRA